MADVPIVDRKSRSPKTPKPPKKRTRNPEEWHKQKQKRLRIAGKEHINTNGKLVPEKKPGGDCMCRRRCFQRIPEAVRVKTFEGFYSLKSHDEQNAYLFGLMRQIDIKRKRKKDSSRRTCTFEYFVRVRGRETQVCQTAFKNIHAITERKVRVLCKKMDDGIMFPSDNRGKNSGNRAGEVRLAPEIIDQVKEHIYSIVHTHRLKDYIRLDKVTGLEINVSKMWKDYIAAYDPDNLHAIVPKSRKPTTNVPEQATIVQQNFQQEASGTVTPETFHSLSYPGSGHLINIAENYFAQAMVSQSQYNPQHLNVGNYIHTDKLSYYQQGQVVIQPALASHPTHATPLGHSDTNTFVILQSMPPTTNQEIRKEDIKDMDKRKKSKKDKKNGPAVKQWRYTNIFHEEINGASLTSIKARMANYFADSEINKKKVKNVHNKPQEVIIQQTQNQHLPVTIAATPLHLRHG